jgi:hypothetical protein
VLSLQSNNLWAEGGKALAEGLKGNRVITGLNISENNLGRDGSSGDPDTSGVTAIANVIQDMRAMSSINLSSNALGDYGANIVSGAAEVNTVFVCVCGSRS